jgi:hypothetical protein
MLLALVNTLLLDNLVIVETNHLGAGISYIYY